MKIKIYESNTNQPYTNKQVQIQVKGKDAGFYTYITDQYGEFYFDDKFNGQQVALLNGILPGQWLAAKDGLTLFLSKQAEKEEFYK